MQIKGEGGGSVWGGGGVLKITAAIAVSDFIFLISSKLVPKQRRS
jgi:hypothetical protein